MADKIVYFTGCWVNYTAPNVGRALTRILHRHKCDVVVPEQVCCGLPMMANANISGAERNFLRNAVSLFAAAQPDGIILTTCPSCTLMLRRQGRVFFDSPEAMWVADHTVDAVSYLLRLQGEKKLETNFRVQSLRYFYQKPCHLQIQDLGQGTLGLLQLLPGLQLAGMSESCCGLGGSYGMKRIHYDRSQAIAQILWGEILRTDAKAGVTDCGGCGLRITEGTGLPVYHPVELLDGAYGGDERDVLPVLEGRRR